RADGNSEPLQRLSSRIGRALEQQLARNAKTRLCGVSIGCLDVEPDDAPDEVVRRARLALTAAKKNPHAASVVYTPALLRATEDSFEQIELARRALKAGWVIPVYQPKMDLGSGRVAGA